MRKIRRGSTLGKNRFTLWREVVVAYVAPTLIAGVGGLVSGQGRLLVSAFTSIGISSAVVAALTGAWLQRSGVRRAWVAEGSRLVAIATVAIAATLLGGLAGWLVNVGASVWLGAHAWPWPDDLGTNLPVSAAIAAAIITWRWRGTQQTQGTGRVERILASPRVEHRDGDPYRPRRWVYWELATASSPSAARESHELFVNSPRPIPGSFESGKWL